MYVNFGGLFPVTVGHEPAQLVDRLRRLDADSCVRVRLRSRQLAICVA